ncbi:MAG TPA: S8 family serine peptidase [Xanthobacteraceae bacterium]|nr:S8 family serine peptidase [Xanthobacteraceae bacterium]
MPFAEARREGTAGSGFAWLRGGRLAIVACALAFAGALALPVEVAAAKSGHHGAKHAVKKSDDDDNNSDASNSAGNATASPAATLNGETNAAEPAPSVSVTTTRNGTGGNLLGDHGSNAPRLGVEVNNSGASVNASIPLGAHHALEPPHNRISHPVLTIPFEHHPAGLAHVLSPTTPSHALSYGDTGTPLFGGGNHALTNRLIRSVTTTYSDHFVNHLTHSLRMQEPGGMREVSIPSASAGAPHDLATRLQEAKHAIAAAAGPRAGTAAPRSPAAVVNNRFAGISGNALEARMFTVPAPGETRYVPNEIVVGAPAGLSTEQVADIARRNGLEPIAGGTFSAAGVTLQRWRVPADRPIGDVIRSLQAEPGLQSAQPNFRFKLAQAAAVSEQPADGFSAQYAPAKLHLAQAHRLSNGAGVLIAVIDTGIDRTHPELTGAIAASFDAIGAREPPDAHGTAIAGAIFAHGRLTGVAPGARLLAIRAFSTAGPDAEATTMTIVRSIEWAQAHGARVINMSFAGAHDPVISRALAQARARGIVLIAAAGNAGPDSPPLYPAADANVIAVSATDIDDHLLDVANRGRQIAIAAPGVDVLLPAPHARYQLATGTSFAAAHVAGIAALMLARNPHLTPDDLRAELVATARDLGPKGRDDMFGAGLADAYKAVVAATGATPQTVAAK